MEAELEVGEGAVAPEEVGGGILALSGVEEVDGAAEVVEGAVGVGEEGEGLAEFAVRGGQHLGIGEVAGLGSVATLGVPNEAAVVVGGLEGLVAGDEQVAESLVGDGGVALRRWIVGLAG